MRWGYCANPDPLRRRLVACGHARSRRGYRGRGCAVVRARAARIGRRAAARGRRHAARRVHRDDDRNRHVEPDGHGVRARWAALCRRADGRPAGDQERRPPLGALRHALGELVGRARPVRRRLRPELRQQQLRLSLLHDVVVARTQSPQPLHRQWRRRGRRIGGRPARSGRPQQRHQPQRRRYPLRPRRQAVHRRRRERELRERAVVQQPVGQDAARQQGRQHTHRQPVLRLHLGQEPGDLGAGPAQSLHVCVPARHRAYVRQRRRPERLGGDQRRYRRLELRLARDRGLDRQSRVPRPAVCLRSRQHQHDGLCHHRRCVL